MLTNELFIAVFILYKFKTHLKDFFNTSFPLYHSCSYLLKKCQSFFCCSRNTIKKILLYFFSEIMCSPFSNHHYIHIHSLKHMHTQICMHLIICVYALLISFALITAFYSEVEVLTDIETSVFIWLQLVLVFPAKFVDGCSVF